LEYTVQTGLRLQEIGDFYHKVDAENQCLINHKRVYGVMNRSRLKRDQTAVIGSMRHTGYVTVRVPRIK